MKVVVSGGTGVIGRAAVTALVAEGHEVAVLSRSEENRRRIEKLGATAVAGDLFDHGSLVVAYDGADAVVNLATHIPVGYAAVWPRAWRANDRLRTVGVGNVVAAATRAGVRRVVQESVSFVYADAGDRWINEDHPVEITPSTESIAVAEAHVQEYAGGPRVGVVLRFGSIIGEDRQTAFNLRAAAQHRPFVFGRPEGWMHPIHSDDLGSAVVAALCAPTGVYNAGAEPVRRADLLAGYAKHVGVAETHTFGPALRRIIGPRAEPLGRSLRVSSERFTSNTGWTPTRAGFDAHWLEVEPRLLGAT